MHHAALVACARWETDDIVEWISYHRLLGFDHLYLYCNDDSPVALYEAVLPFIGGPSPYVTFHFHAPLGQQKEMYLHFLRHHKAETEWFMFLDIDEFLRLPAHGNIHAFIAQMGRDTDGIYVNWASFGHCGHLERPGGSVLLTYTRRAAGIYDGSAKVLTRAAAIDVRRLGLGPRSDFWHYWDSLENFRALRLINVLGDDVHDYCEDQAKWNAYLRQPEVFARMLSTAVVNHYAYKSLKDFLRRRERGAEGNFVNQADQARHYSNGQGEAMMAVMNAVEDRVLHDLWAGVLAGGARTTTTGRRNLAAGRQALRSADGWVLDLGGIETITEIRLGQGANLAVSIDGEAWMELAASTAAWAGPGTAWARYVRVGMAEPPGAVEVFGK